MTTKITIETGSHPIALHQNSEHNHDTPTYRTNSYINSAEFIGPNQTYVTYASLKSRISISELPENWTSLDGPEFKQTLITAPDSCAY